MMVNNTELCDIFIASGKLLPHTLDNRHNPTPAEMS
jgi:hypothetical protein